MIYSLKMILSLLFVLTSLGCNSHKDNHVAKNSRVENQSNADICLHANIALEFMNSYTEHCTNVMIKKDTLSDIQWVSNNKLISSDFKNSYETLLTKTKAADEELGLGFDPILDAQDFPESGFVMANCDQHSDYIELKGKEWPDFKVTVKLIRIGTQWFVDGAGVINIPVANRSKR